MKRILFPLIFVLFLAACGSSGNEVGTASNEIPEETEVTEGSLPFADDSNQPVPDPDDGILDDSNQPVPDSDDGLIVNDVIVDPQVTTPTELLLNPENDSELWVRFTGGDPNCTAASASVVTETPDLVEVELLVGITEDALSRSCMAGEFDLRVNVALNESGAGKDLQAVEAGPADPQLVTPDLNTDDFLGLTEAEASAIADENIIMWRTVAVDGEFFAVTQDFDPGRLNFEFNDGVITNVTFG